MALTNGRGADLVFESSGDPELWPLALRCVAQAGRLVSCGAHGGGNVQLDLKRLYVGRIQVIGAAGVNVSDLDWALAAGARGDIRATIDRVYPLECAAEAQDYVEHERPLGKVLIAPGRNFEMFGKSGHRHELRTSAAALRSCHLQEVEMSGNNPK